MRILITATVLCLATLAPQWAVAGPQADALSNCLSENTNGKERKELARWVFLGMSAHPEIRALTTADAKTRTDSQKWMGTLVTRLLSENCAAQTRAAVQSEGSAGMMAAFRSLGELAMRELMTNGDVAAALSGYEQYLDKKKLEAAMSTQ